MRPRQEYIALHDIAYNGVPAYKTGDDVTAAVVDRLQLQVGVDVRPANPDVIPRPAANAKRADWEAYAVGQGLDPDEVADMTVTDIRDRFPAPETTDATPVPLPPARNAAKSDWVDWVVLARGVDRGAVAAMGRDDIVATYAPKG